MLGPGQPQDPTPRDRATQAVPDGRAADDGLQLALGSPCIYGNVTEAMRGFLENLERLAKARRIDVKGKPAMIFGSYGWDGAWVMEEWLKDKARDIGFKVKDEVCVEVGDNIKYHADQYLGKCKEFSKDFAESLK